MIKYNCNYLFIMLESHKKVLVSSDEVGVQKENKFQFFLTT